MIFDCIENGNMAKLEECLMGLNPRTGLETLKDEKGFTPLASAINFSQLQVLCRLHEFMAGHKQKIQQGSSDSNLLQLAIKNSKTGNGKKVLEFVLTQWGTQLAFIRNPQSGQSALHLAASRGLVEVFVFLLTRADRSVLYDELRSGDNTGQNPLHLSASNKHVDVVRELLAFAPTLALRKDGKGETALHKAVEAGEKPIVQKILEHSPMSILETNDDHRNAYQLAKHKIDLQLKGIASHNTPSPNTLEIELYLKEWILRHPGLDPATIRQLVFSSTFFILSYHIKHIIDSSRSWYDFSVIPLYLHGG
jgi:ankyrin repeat protein